MTDKSDLKKQLIDAQRVWVKFREADCQAIYTLWSDVTIRNAMYIECMSTRAQQRIKELNEFHP